MLGPRAQRGCVALLVAVLALAAGPAGAQAVAPEADHTPPVLTFTQDPPSPTFGKNGWFNSQDLAAPGSRVRVSVSATDEAGVDRFSCSGPGGNLPVSGSA